MSLMYAMQRANGDWFAFADHGRLRVPVFHNTAAALHARASNYGMLLFKPVALDERALASMGAEDAVGYWLVEDSARDLSRSRPLEQAQLSRSYAIPGGERKGEACD